MQGQGGPGGVEGRGDGSRASRAIRVAAELGADLKRELLEGAKGISGGDNAEHKKNDEALVKRLYQQIGQLKVEKDFLESRLGR